MKNLLNFQFSIASLMQNWTELTQREVNEGKVQDDNHDYTISWRFLTFSHSKTGRKLKFNGNFKNSNQQILDKLQNCLS